MKKLRNYNYEQDAERLAENLVINYSDQIEDMQSFEEAYLDYLKDFPEARNNQLLKRNTYRKMREGKGISPVIKRRLASAEKKKFSKLRQEKGGSRRIVRKRGERKVVHKYLFEGKEKGRTVYARKIRVKWGVAYVDKRGRRVSVKVSKATTTARKQRRKLHASKSRLLTRRYGESVNDFFRG